LTDFLVKIFGSGFTWNFPYHPKALNFCEQENVMKGLLSLPEDVLDGKVIK
jgi:hypothetical protein